jgi:anti-anti-sigma factor
MLEVKKEDGKTIIKTGSRIDTGNAVQFEQELLPLLNEGGMKLVIDCDDLTYMASSGLRVIQKAMRSLVQIKGEISMINVNPPIFKVLDMTGFLQFMKVEQKKG